MGIWRIVLVVLMVGGSAGVWACSGNEARHAEARMGAGAGGAVSAFGEGAGAMTRGEMLTEIAERLGRLRHVRREPSSLGAMDDVAETLASADAKLTDGDLRKMRMLLEWLGRPGIAGEILQLGRADRADTDTEHGGVLVVRGDGIEIRVMPPMFGGNDMEYVTPDEAMALAATSLALFHFHFARADSSENAGPGGGDLRFARANRVTCVVFTSLDERTFDVDYYTAEGAVVDLGVYHEF